MFLHNVIDYTLFYESKKCLSYLFNMEFTEKNFSLHIQEYFIGSGTFS